MAKRTRRKIDGALKAKIAVEALREGAMVTDPCTTFMRYIRTTSSDVRP